MIFLASLVIAIDWASKGLTVLLLILASLWVAWQCIEGLAKLTRTGAEFRHFIVNRRNFDRWLRQTKEEEARDRAATDKYLDSTEDELGGANGKD